MVIIDASLVGGGGVLMQWRRLPERRAAERVAEELKTAGINPDGTLRHNYDPQQYHLGSNWAFELEVESYQSEVQHL